MHRIVACCSVAMLMNVTCTGAVLLASELRHTEPRPSLALTTATTPLLISQANDVEVALILRLMVWAIGSSATYLALHVQSVLQLWLLCSEFVYVLLFPQLLCAFYFKNTNAYGSLLGEGMTFAFSGVSERGSEFKSTRG